MIEQHRPGWSGQSAEPARQFGPVRMTGKALDAADPSPYPACGPEQSDFSGAVSYFAAGSLPVL